MIGYPLDQRISKKRKISIFEFVQIRKVVDSTGHYRTIEMPLLYVEHGKTSVQHTQAVKLSNLAKKLMGPKLLKLRVRDGLRKRHEDSLKSGDWVESIKVKLG